jgi:hypothetical protein
MKKLNFIFTITFFSFILLQLFSSCNGKHKKDDNDVFEKGKVIASVQCKKDVTQSYALYLPSNYSEDKKWPVVYVFDSHAKGSLPVELFKDEAEKYGYIIIGSNNSKNGTPWDVTEAIYDTLYNDTHLRFSIDDRRIYTAGFSGGSRVASTLAITKKGIIAVIGCGAGFGLQKRRKQKFSYFGIAGNADMNLTEMIFLDSSLERSKFRHYLQTFDGKHEWPPKSVVADAFLWLEMNAMKDKLKTINDTLVSNRLKKWKSKYDSLYGKNNYYEAYLLCKKIINFFDGLTDVSDLKKGKSILEKNSAVLSTLKHLNEIAEKESGMQTYYSNAIPSQSADWWKIKVAMMNEKTKTVQDNEEKFMYKRLLNYLSLAAYMYVNNSMKKGDMEKAEKFNIIYSLVDPENPEHAYISATLSMKKGNKEEALLFLEKAAELGFTEASRLENDTVMLTLKQNEKYSKILDSIKNNANKK